MAKDYSYQLPDPRSVEKELKKYPKRLLAFDPGFRNMGVAVVGVDPNKGKIKVLANAVLMHPISDLVNLGESHPVFMEEVQGWFDMFQPHGIIAERFQIRGSSSAGKSCEAVSIMLGCLKQAYPTLPFKLVIASQWKNALQKRFEVDLKEVYKQTLILPHQLDACYIGCYGLEQGLQEEFEYTVDGIYLNAEDTSLSPFIQRKGLKR